ncbi:hypothetical protein [Priestia megaterium]|uniref:hypothetical protein n=1 Tax=Priestia megaterium TaxID=1404 RepID=UPI000BFD4DBD|nr:hypothetical protein [Priestia megaterium]PGQ79704.1 hypothetical protein COA18_28045 [Priestia megaterium]
MKRTTLLNKINNCLAYDYEIHEAEVMVYGELKKMLICYLKEEYVGVSIMDHYQEAIDLIYSTADIYEVTLVEWAKSRAFSYYKDKEDGRVLIGLEDFDLFVKGQCECAKKKIGTDLTEMHFAIQTLSGKHLTKISEMRRLSDVINYIITLPYIEAVQTRGWFEEYDFEDGANELNDLKEDSKELEDLLY